MVYLTLFLSAFLSATLFPLGSEALFIYNLKEGYNLFLLLFIVTLGNSLGSIVNYIFGLKGENYLISKKILAEQNIIKYKNYFDKYGSICILFAWLPIIGDSITFIAGVLKFDLKKFIILVTISKFLRYLFIVLII